ncbi:MAG TPA: response regulator [Chloroflexota bacterium]|nr:response regulator [Chloroflexota bacterium]
MPAPHPIRSGAFAGRVVLVAEDDEDVRDVARSALEEQLGVRVIEAGDGGEALLLIQAEKPSLVIMDLMLPKMLGWQVVRQTRADPNTRDTPIIALSGTGDRWGALEVGCNDYLNKPFVVDQLVGMARRWLTTPQPAR